VIGFINPHRVDCGYNYNISGCFVAFCLVLSVWNKRNSEGNPIVAFSSVIPYVALSTITDQMSLADPLNRQIVELGLRVINSGSSAVFNTLANLTLAKLPLTTKEFGFTIGPIVNTANRVGNEEIAFKLLSSDDGKILTNTANELIHYNKRRKNAQSFLIKDLLRKKDDFLGTNSIVCSITTTYAIAGNVASNLGNRYQLPAVCFTENIDSPYLTGSCRGILPQIDLMEIFRAMDAVQPGLFIKFGGHKGAAGCSINKDRYEIFKQLFDELCSNYITEKDRLLVNYVDFCSSGDIYTDLLCFIMSSDQIYGRGWEPVKLVSRVILKNVLLEPTYAKLTFSICDVDVTGIYFMGDESCNTLLDTIKNSNSAYDVLCVYTPEINRYMDNVNVNLLVDTIKIIKDTDDYDA
jgi:single-stranded-DNA-specific exonuclease